MDPRSPKQRIGPDRRPETLPEPIQRPVRAPKSVKRRARPRPGRLWGVPIPRQVAQQQSQIEAADMDQQSLAHVGVAPDEDPTQPSRAGLVRERSIHPLAPPSLQPSPPPPPDPLPIRVHRHLVFPVLPLPIPPAPIRFRQIPPQSEFLQLQRCAGSYAVPDTYPPFPRRTLGAPGTPNRPLQTMDLVSSRTS